jgi:hypothetical protein
MTLTDEISAGSYALRFKARLNDGLASRTETRDYQFIVLRLTPTQSVYEFEFQLGTPS